jgi:outer membrane lipoprotein SlyB
VYCAPGEDVVLLPPLEKNMYTRKFAAFSLALVFVAACASGPLTQREKATVTGALLGAGAGAIIGNQSGNAAEGAAIGGALGALTGARAGDQQQRQAQDLDELERKLDEQEREIENQKRQIEELEGR